MRGIFVILFVLLMSTSHADELDTARAAINDMEYAQAITLLEQYLAQQPDDAQTRYLLARVYVWDNQFEPAVREYSRLLVPEPENAEYLYGKAQALMWLDKNREALPLLEQAWRLANDNVDIWKSYILLLHQSKEANERLRAQELVQQAREKFPMVEWSLIIN